MFAEWNNYFLLLGTAAATLIGLLFLVISLISNMPNRSASGGKVYTTPVVFHLSMSLATSALLLAPHVSLSVAALAVALCAGLGVAYAGYVCLKLLLPNEVNMTHWSDLVCYGLIPGAIYLALLAAAWLIWRNQTTAPDVTAATLLALLLVSIRNAWDLITYIAPRTAPAAPTSDETETP